LKQNHPI